jgi:uncharacterized protein
MNLPVIDKWYADGLAFQCTQCGNCCTGGPGYVWMSDTEVQRFADHLKMDKLAFLKKYCRIIGGRVSLKERKNLRNEYDCIFLKELQINEQGRIRTQRICTAYDMRPTQCRTWPFWDGVLSSPESWKKAARGCPGMNQGKTYTLDEIEARRTADDAT